MAAGSSQTLHFSVLDISGLGLGTLFEYFPFFGEVSSTIRVVSSWMGS
jgi:hypothetical protein